MGKSSIHVRPVRAGSEQHNEREKKLGYVREDLTPQNTSFKLATVAQARADAVARYQASTGQRMQVKAAPIREGVLLIEERHTAEDLRKVGQAIEERFGIRTIQGYAHKDEGHYDQATSEWKPNYHGHLVFDWTDQATGKSIRMKRDDMAEPNDRSHRARSGARTEQQHPPFEFHPVQAPAGGAEPKNGLQASKRTA